MADFKFEGFDIERIKQQVLHSAEEKLNREVGTLSCPEHGPQRSPSSGWSRAGTSQRLKVDAATDSARSSRIEFAASCSDSAGLLSGRQRVKLH